MSNEEKIRDKIISLKSMAHLMLQRCSELENELEGTATPSTPQKGKSKLDMEKAARILARRQATIYKKVHA